ncbi:hypothetical protein OVA28_16800 [Curtobacterium sp. SL109]|nr:hypothetical protein [Curtobacterium sp. SL109]MCY1696043.1 hypothetical protein [Curtobacterium sp. SL109]
MAERDEDERRVAREFSGGGDHVGRPGEREGLVLPGHQHVDARDRGEEGRTPDRPHHGDRRRVERDTGTADPGPGDERGDALRAARPEHRGSGQVDDVGALDQVERDVVGAEERAGAPVRHGRPADAAPHGHHGTGRRPGVVADPRAHPGVLEGALVAVHVVDPDPTDQVHLRTEPSEPRGGGAGSPGGSVSDHGGGVVVAGRPGARLDEHAVEDVADDQEAFPGTAASAPDRPSVTGCCGAEGRHGAFGRRGHHLHDT